MNSIIATIYTNFLGNVVVEKGKTRVGEFGLFSSEILNPMIEPPTNTIISGKPELRWQRFKELVFILHGITVSDTFKPDLNSQMVFR